MANESCDVEIWDKDGFTAINGSKRIETDHIMRHPELLAKIFTAQSDKLITEQDQRSKLSAMLVFEGKVMGSKEKLETSLTQDIGKKVVIIPL